MAIIVLRGGVSGRNSGQRVEGRSKPAPASAPGVRTMTNRVAPSGEATAPPSVPFFRNADDAHQVAHLGLDLAQDRD